MFQDCIDAIAYLRAHAADYHLDAEHMGVMGESAGGHIAGVVAMAGGSNIYAHFDKPVQAAVLWCGFYDMTREGMGPGKFTSNPRDDFSYLLPQPDL